MTTFFAPTIPIGRIEWDSACRVLEKCPTASHQRALPYLIALYSFIHWWENYAESEATERELLSESETSDRPPLDLDITTHLCEFSQRPLVNLATLSIRGIRLIINPVAAVDQISFEDVTPAQLTQGEFYIAVYPDLEHQWATLLGFISSAELQQHLQTAEPNLLLPLEALHPMSFFPSVIRRLQDSPPHDPSSDSITLAP